jgi:hypothetical protein
MTQEQREQGYISLIIIKSCSLDFMVELTNLAVEYAKEKGYDGFMQNTPDGFYEMVLKPKTT